MTITPDRKQVLALRAMMLAEQIRNQRATPGTDDEGLRAFVRTTSSIMVYPPNDEEVQWIVNKIRFHFLHWITRKGHA